MSYDYLSRISFKKKSKIMLIQISNQSIHVLAKTDNIVIFIANIRRSCSADNNYLLTSVICQLFLFSSII